MISEMFIAIDQCKTCLFFYIS